VAGVSLLVEIFSRSGVDAVANKLLPAKGSAKGLKQGQTVESFVLLSALGGECVEDMQRLRDDAGLAGILGYTDHQHLKLQGSGLIGFMMSP